MAETHMIAVHTYGSQRVKDPKTNGIVSAHKIGYTSAACDVLVALYGAKARDVSSPQTSYRYLQIDGDTTVKHGYLLLNLTADELALAEAVTRRSYRAAVFLWRDNQWLELPSSPTADYLEPTARSGPGFNPCGYRPVSPSTGEKETAGAMQSTVGIRAERVQRSPNEKPWYWLHGDTSPHRDLLKRHGARFSGKRRTWYWIGWELPAALLPFIGTSLEAVCDPGSREQEDHAASRMSPELERHIPEGVAQDDAHAPAPPSESCVCEPFGTKGWFPAKDSGTWVKCGACNPDGLNPPDHLPAGAVIEQPKRAEDEKRPAIRVIRPTSFPADGEALDAIQTAIRDARFQPTQAHAQDRVVHTSTRAMPIGQRYCGELTGSITGQVFCYGYAVHDGICVYVSMGGPRTSVEAIRAKLSKGDIVTVVPDDAPAIELTAGEGNSGMYSDYLQTIPEARFTSLILLHDWVVHPNYGGAATTFLFRVDEAQARAQLTQHITQLVNLPVFEDWTDYLWTAGQTAMLVHPNRSAGGIDLLTISLDATAWTRLITGGIEQHIITLPDIH